MKLLRGFSGDLEGTLATPPSESKHYTPELFEHNESIHAGGSVARGRYTGNCMGIKVRTSSIPKSRIRTDAAEEYRSRTFTHQGEAQAGRGLARSMRREQELGKNQNGSNFAACLTIVFRDCFSTQHRYLSHLLTYLPTYLLAELRAGQDSAHAPSATTTLN